MRIIGAALVVAASVLVVTPASAAGGAVVSVGGQTLSIAGTDAVEVITDVAVCGASCIRVDALTDIVAGPGCAEPLGNDVIECSITAPVMLVITLGGGNDRLALGSLGRDLLVSTDAGPGDDTLQGAGARETWVGGDGNDRLAPDGRNLMTDVGPDDILLGAGHDLVDYSHSAGTAASGLTLSLDNIANDSTTAPDDIDNVRTDVEEVYGGPGADTIIGSDLPETLNGGPGNDTIDAGGGADRVFGNDGDDRITGGSGKDLLHGDDTAPWSAGNDAIEAVDGEADVVPCGPGTDSLHADNHDAGVDCEAVTIAPALVTPVQAGRIGLAGGGRIDATQRRTRAKVALSCAGRSSDGACTGTLVARAGRAKVAAGHYTVTASTTRTVKVKLTRKARALLEARSKTAVKVTFTPSVGAAVTTKATLVR